MMDSIKNFRIKQMSPQLQVADIERSLEFYTKQLGFEIEFRYENLYAGISKDGHSIHLKMADQPLEQNKKMIMRLFRSCLQLNTFMICIKTY
jgi:catechol-2,3-dioxygenase